MFWPSELSEKEAELSVIPELLKSQDQFISILSVQVDQVSSLFSIVDSAQMPGNLFLKHLVVLADFGGEMLQRVNNEFDKLFPNHVLDYFWDGTRTSYAFESLPVSGKLTNNKLGISGKRLFEKQPLSVLHKDVIALLLLGNSCLDESTANVLTKCEIGNYLGQPDELSKFIKQRYIWVSRITAGSQSNSLGQLAQQFVRDYLEQELACLNVRITSNGCIPGVSHRKESTGRPTTFDLVLNHKEQYVAVEVSFQVTTNSVIERKAGQAQARYRQIKEQNYKIAYVLDGAGNFQRESALSVICEYSDCTVAFSKDELNVLVQFIKGYFLLE